jgi:iron complex transport system permease protein
MMPASLSLSARMTLVVLALSLLLMAVIVLGLTMGSSESNFHAVWNTLFRNGTGDTMQAAIIWRIRLPRVLLAALVGAALSLGGLVFQALLKNPLAEPYILGISGGAAIGAIVGIILGLSRIPGVSTTAFAGSLATLMLIIVISSGRAVLVKDALLLSGVMVNAFCTAVIMFLLSMTQDARLHNIIFWLMGDLSASQIHHVGMLAAILLPCFIVIFLQSNRMNLLLLGSDMAASMGVQVRLDDADAAGGHLVDDQRYRQPVWSHRFCRPGDPPSAAPDRRSGPPCTLVPACMLGGGSYMVVCDVLSRVLPAQGEMPGGVITAMIGAPLFIVLLTRSKR